MPAQFRVALVSANGGVGRSSLTAALAQLLLQRGAVLAVDFDPQNFLGVCLGTVHPPERGSASAAAAGDAPAEPLRLAAGLRLQAFGHSSAQQRAVFEQTLLAQPQWLATHVRTLAAQGPELVLIDAGRVPSLYAEQALASADLVLALCRCDLASLAAIDRLRAGVGERPLAWVINQFDPTRQLQQDIQLVLQSRLQGSPQFVLHHDAALPEAQASNQALVAHAPHSQLALDIQALAIWLEARASPA